MTEQLPQQAAKFSAYKILEFEKWIKMNFVFSVFPSITLTYIHDI